MAQYDRLAERFPGLSREAATEILRTHHGDACAASNTLNNLRSLIELFPDRRPGEVKDILFSYAGNVDAAFEELFNLTFHAHCTIPELLEERTNDATCPYDVTCPNDVICLNPVYVPNPPFDETDYQRRQPRPQAEYFLEVDDCNFHTAVIVVIHDDVWRFSYGDQSKHCLNISSGTKLDPPHGESVRLISFGCRECSRDILHRMKPGVRYSLLTHNCRTFAFSFLVAAGFEYSYIRSKFFEENLSCGLPGGICISWSNIASVVCVIGK